MVFGLVAKELAIMGICIWVFSKIRGTLLGVPIKRIIVLRGLHWGPPVLGHCHTWLGVQGLGWVV